MCWTELEVGRSAGHPVDAASAGLEAAMIAAWIERGLELMMVVAAKAELKVFVIELQEEQQVAEPERLVAVYAVDTIGAQTTTSNRPPIDADARHTERNGKSTPSTAVVARLCNANAMMSGVDIRRGDNLR